MIKPLITVITVTYNAGETILRTLESVDNQTFNHYEHLIVDGASSDETLTHLENHPSQRRKIISERDAGLYDAMNKGLRMAEGDYVVFLNAGDKFHDRETLALVADAILENDYPGVVYGQTDIVGPDGKRIGPRHLEAPEILTVESFRNGMMVCHQAFFALRKIAGDYNLKYRFSADYDWCIRVLQRSRRNFYVDAVVVDYLAEGMTTRNHRASLLERYRIMSHYYGWFGTTLRHIGFFFRDLRRKIAGR